MVIPLGGQMELDKAHPGRFVRPNRGFRKGQRAKVVTRKSGTVIVQFADYTRAAYQPHELDDRES